MDQTLMRTKLDPVRNLIDRGFVYFDFEKLLEHHYRRWVQSGDTVIDVGAHVGRHLSPLLECVGADGRVIAFEPIPVMYEILKSKFDHRPATLNNVALSNYCGVSEFTYAEGTPEESGLIERRFNNPDAAMPSTISVKVETLDQHTQSLSSLSFIKIDVEGGEIDCLRGAANTIERFRPVISLEYGELAYLAYGNTGDTLFEFATENKYLIFDLFMNCINSIEDWRSSLNYVYWDFILVPHEKLHDFNSRVVTPGVKMADSRYDQPDDSILANNLECCKDERNQALLTIESFQRELANLRSSTSWRITAPLRRLITLIRSYKNNGGK